MGKAGAWRTGVTCGFFLVAALPLSAQETAKFSIDRFEIVGNSLLSADDIARRIAPYTGPGKVYGDVQKALEAVEAAYRERGFGAVQVTVPEQEITQGVVRLDVVEAKIRTIAVNGNAHFDEANILGSLPSLALDTTPNARILSEQVQLANENPAKKVDVVLAQGEQDDELDLRIDVKDQKPWSGFLTSDNTGNLSTGRDRSGFVLQHANLFDRDQVGTLSYTTSLEHPDRTKVFGASYRLPIYALGDSMDVIVGKSDVAAATATTVAGPLQFSGKGMVYGLRYNHILPRRGEYSHRFVFGIDQREFDNSCTLNGQAVCGSGGADITLRPVSVTYTGQFDHPGRTSLFSLSAATNLPGGKNARQEDFTLNRTNAKAGYTVFRGNLSHTQSFARDWQFRVLAAGQYTQDALVAGEQFGMAGSTAVRGFNERAVTADRGYYGTVELYSPDLAASAKLGGNLRLLGFYDHAAGSFNQFAPGVYSAAHISSAGVGFRYSMGQKLALRGDLARVTDSGPKDTALEGSWRGHVGMVIGF
ncbi:ShlB/FhaC/HecB family hemolysin secretion/activation protein [Propionivibrio dicarboxylicus]|uniref:Hemolysin activation/secretion protein n=1 Tax=Propionivibrio dicarboxylicus TaxID=83767 RepID=A0A1G8AEQ7_9RHOO|nr:ShlB/FhaC/HecB family hemolysin secretion/activation protein [Propionivibrio dicarboxylicus]SDH19357.1 Hemolysin activation/secretion protein [Propionivibrio dicarboxylicus]